MTAVFYVGDAIEVMSKLPEKSVDLILTSPPFLALRSYLPADHPDKAKEGGSQSTPGEFIDWLLDVAEACDRVLAPHGSLCIELGDTYSGSGGGGGDYYEGGLREGQPGFTGSEAASRDALKAANAAHWRQKNEWRANTSADDREPLGGRAKRSGRSDAWPLAKSLSLIPESFRFAMVYGFNPHTGRTTEPWRLRNVIRWVRPNPPVGALGDKFRPATSELMVFCKSAKRYFDLDAVREPADPANKRPSLLKRESIPGRTDQVMNPIGPDGQRIISNPAGAPPLDWWNIPLLEGEEETRYGPKSEAQKRDEFNAKYRAPGGFYPSGKREGGIPERGDKGASNFPPHELGAPPLDWWEIPPGGYEGAHYAVFPPELCVKPVKAMCPEFVCRICGEPSRRIVENTGDYSVNDPQGGPKGRPDLHLSERLAAGGGRFGTAQTLTTGWTNCGCSDGHCSNDYGDWACPEHWRPGLVLDPFAGSGTTLAVATGHGRDAIGIDLDERNYELALERVGPFMLERAS